MYFFFFTDPGPTDIYTLSHHDPLRILGGHQPRRADLVAVVVHGRHRLRVWSGTGIAIDLGSSLRSIAIPVPDHTRSRRSEEHTSELQSPDHLAYRLLLDKKKL